MVFAFALLLLLVYSVAADQQYALGRFIVTIEPTPLSVRISRANTSTALWSSLPGPLP